MFFSLLSYLASSQCRNCQSVIATLWCQLCDNHYCTTCSSDIHQHRAFSDHRPLPIDQKSPEILLCVQCSKKELDFLCHDCATVVCGDCLLSTHKDHSFVFITVAIKDIVTEVSFVFKYKNILSNLVCFLG